MQNETLWITGGEPKCFACTYELVGVKKLCYACSNGRLGEIRSDDSFWECRCSKWRCTCKFNKTTNQLGYCPICRSRFEQSKHLAGTFRDERMAWLANMVTHYRHNHRKWDDQHTYISSRLHNSEAEYEKAKKIVNEQAKRQIIRKCKDFLIANGITADCFALLQHTEKKTMEVAAKLLG